MGYSTPKARRRLDEKIAECDALIREAEVDFFKAAEMKKGQEADFPR